MTRTEIASRLRRHWPDLDVIVEPVNDPIIQHLASVFKAGEAGIVDLMIRSDRTVEVPDCGQYGPLEFADIDKSIEWLLAGDRLRVAVTADFSKIRITG